VKGVLRVSLGGCRFVCVLRSNIGSMESEADKPPSLAQRHTQITQFILVSAPEGQRSLRQTLCFCRAMAMASSRRLG
jgi:hypothetical protein